MVLRPPRISVVVPTYRRTTYLRAALTSALTPTFRDIEVFVSDNSEDDAIEQIVRDLDDPRIRYRRHEQNIGIVANFTTAVADATCDVVACLHDDDFWEPTFLERVGVPVLEDPSLALGCCDFTLVDEEGRPLTRQTAETDRRRHRNAEAGTMRLDDGSAMAAVLADGLVQPAYNSVFRRSLIAGKTMPEDLYPLYDLWIRELLCRAGASIHFVPERLTSYRIHTASYTSQYSFLAPAGAAYERYLRVPEFAPMYPELTRFLVEDRRHCANEHLHNGDYEGFRRQLALVGPYVDGWRAAGYTVLRHLGPLSPALRRAYIAKRERQRRRP